MSVHARLLTKYRYVGPRFKLGLYPGEWYDEIVEGLQE